jgi:hypothetical protein
MPLVLMELLATPLEPVLSSYCVDDGGTIPFIRM